MLRCFFAVSRLMRRIASFSCLFYSCHLLQLDDIEGAGEGGAVLRKPLHTAYFTETVLSIAEKASYCS
jgi:hypothetical protein